MMKALKYLTCVLFCCLGTLPSARARAEQPARVFALIIGSNATLSPEQAPLHFADDDAARLYELLTEAGADAELLTTLDQESQATFAPLVKNVRPQTRAEVLAAHKRLVQRMDDARRAGAESIDYVIYYSGHGDVGPDGQGYLALSDGGKLNRSDLFVEILGTSTADFNHIVVDACKSEELVLSRGDGWKPDKSETDYSQAVSEYLQSRHLGKFPNTGVILASSADQQTHEWQHYRGGVFSHELFSGLRGGADVNGDGRIEYSELGAFASAANSGVQDVRARLRVVVEPPQSDRRRPLLLHRDVAKQRVLVFPSADRHRYRVEDTRGVRVADVRRSGEHPGYLRLPAGRLFVYRETDREGAGDTQESSIAALQNGPVRTDKLRFVPSKNASRGALSQAFQSGLFSVPFGAGYYAGYTDTHGLLAVQSATWEVTVWRDVDGTPVAEPAPAPVPPPSPRAAEKPAKDASVPEQRPKVWGPRDGFGTFGLALALSTTRASTPTDPGTLKDTEARPWFGSVVRGVEGSWGVFRFGRRKYEDLEGEILVRSGYYRGSQAFIQSGAMAVRALDYYRVPLFFGFNGYFPGFEEVPVNPYAGLGVGADLLHLKTDGKTDTSLRIGAEVHLGMAFWITENIGIGGEARYTWSDDRDWSAAPKFSLDGLTVSTRLSIAFPLLPTREVPQPNPRQGAERLRVDVRDGKEGVTVRRLEPARTE